MKRKLLKYTGIVMVVIATIFIIIAFNHPEFAWPWSNTVTYILYGLYLIVMSIMFVTGKVISDKDKNENKKKNKK